MLQEMVKEMMNEMDVVFSLAKEKAITSLEKPNHTKEPWNDFHNGFLVGRLFEEIREFENTNDIKSENEEILDIINTAVFLYLSNEKEMVV